MTTLSHENTHAHTPHQCFYLSPFDINGKGYLSLGMLPLTQLTLGLLPLSTLSLGCSPCIHAYDYSLTPRVNMSPHDTVPTVTNHGKKNNSPCGYVSPFLLCKMSCNHCEQYVSTVIYFCCGYFCSTGTLINFSTILYHEYHDLLFL
jgi:hypothetical protein